MICRDSAPGAGGGCPPIQFDHTVPLDKNRLPQDLSLLRIISRGRGSPGRICSRQVGILGGHENPLLAGPSFPTCNHLLDGASHQPCAAGHQDALWPGCVRHDDKACQGEEVKRTYTDVLRRKQWWNRGWFTGCSSAGRKLFLVFIDYWHNTFHMVL